MKRTKRFLCVLLAVLMAASVCGGLLSSAEAVYSLVEQEGGAYTFAGGVKYNQYTMTSGINGTTVNASSLEFNSDDYVVMAYTGHVAGGVATLDEYYDMAVADGYEVVGMINGSFFTVSTGIMDEYDVVNGVLVCASANNPSKFDGMTVLKSDGTIQGVDKSELALRLSFNGVEAKNLLTSINKSGGTDASGWSDGFYYFDSYSGTMTGSSDRAGQVLTYEACPGYEIVCKKETNSDLSIGGTLYGEVTEIREAQYGCELEEDEFLLFMKADSSKKEVFDSVAVGDTVTIAVEETVAGAYETTGDALSVFENPSWLVKDGVNLVEQDAYNTRGYWHDNEFKARWAVFGTKEDGTWVFFTSDGGSSGSTPNVTLQDIAKAMIDKGCTNVIRMDGGGSVGLYVSDTGNGTDGYKQSHTRDVVDCIMVVKRSSPALNGTAKADLEALLETVSSETSKAYTEAIANAETVLDCKTSVSGDFLRAYRELIEVGKSYESLADAVAKAEALEQDAYAPTVWESIQTLLAEAKALQADDSATLSDLASTASALQNAIASIGTYTHNVALGKSYVTDPAANASYADDGGELTDGSYSSALDGKASGWSGYTAATYTVTVDLGEVYDSIDTFNACFLQIPDWGVMAPKSVNVSVSADGETFTAVGTAAPSVTVDSSKSNVAYDFVLKISKNVSARYVKFEIAKNSAWCFMSEVEVIRTEKAYGDAAVAGVPGDLTGDGVVDLSDYMLVRYALLQKIELDETEFACADVVTDGELTLQDAMLIRYAILGAVDLSEG